jgi:exopolysaccharide biosynthesis protein
MPVVALVSLVWVLVGAGGEAPGWAELAPGVSHRTIEEDFRAVLLRFDLERVRVDVAVPGPDAAQRAGELRAARRAIAVVNGGFFDTSGKTLGLRIGGGKTVVPLRPRVDWGVLTVRDRRARIVHSREHRPDPAITAAIQVGPRILAGGKPLKLKPQRALRTAVALDAEGRHLTLIVTRDSVEANALARVLETLGFDSALMLDGGPSTQLSARIGPTSIEVEGGYAVPDLLLILPRKN